MAMALVERLKHGVELLLCNSRCNHRFLTVQITPVLKPLHWLPVHFRIDFKVLLLFFKCMGVGGMGWDVLMFWDCKHCCIFLFV